MTTRDDMETKLLRALTVEPSEDGLLWLDQRVALLAARSPMNPRHGATGLRMILRSLVLVAALLALAGAVAAGIGLIERMLESTPGWRTAYERAEVINSSQTDAGLTLTLERAYADLNQVVVFITVEGLAAPRSSDGVATDHLAIFGAGLRDPTGRMPAMESAIADAEPGLGAAVWSFQFDPPITVAGNYELTIPSIGYGADGPDCVSPCANDPIAGTWRFEFELPAPQGTAVATEASDAVGQATLRLSELRVSPTMVSARIAMSVDDKPVAYWSFIPGKDDLRHGGSSYGLWSGRHILDKAPSEEGPEMEFYTTAGVDSAKGTWEIVIPELDYGMTNDEVLHVSGPWTLTVTVP
jgi:hypothetical protein